MTRVSGQLKSSVNAGQLARSLAGKVNLKQYYSGALVMRGVEPIPQSGFQLLPGSAYVAPGVAGACKKGVLQVSKARSYTVILTEGRAEIWRNDRVKVATLTGGLLAQISAARVPELEFYGEANTFGIFHPDIWGGIRLLRDGSDDTIWTISAWPYGDLPKLDLGGVYPKTNDRWHIYIRTSANTPSFVMNVTIDGNVSASATLLDSGGNPAKPDDLIGLAGVAAWEEFAATLQGHARELPGMSSGLTITNITAGTTQHYRTLQVTFGGDLSGKEYQLDAQVLNTSEASSLASHTTIGKTDGEPLVSADQGGFRGAANYQDRQVYFAPSARATALAMSRTGEYFDLNIDATDDAAARLEALRTETSETILHVLDATYLIAFTDRAMYFASNRTVKRNEPMNWVRAIEIGSKASCKPVTLEARVYFVSADGGRLYSAAYDAVSEMFQPTPENDLNGGPEDLVTNIRSMSVQQKTAGMISDRLWLLREDGRLVCCVINRTQEIMAAVEWPVHGGGFVHAMAIDGQGQVWLTVERGGVVSEEILEEESDNLFQQAMTVTTDLAGQASGLAMLDGKTVWALIENDVYGPFTVAGGTIETGVASKSAKIGLWSPPWYESMPYVRVLPNDDIVRRPGKVGSARLYLRDTASIAIGANGRPPRDLPLNRSSDDLSQPKLNFTGHVNIAGLIGACMDPTLVISQVRPGRLNVRDYIPGVKL
ncbi:hypothetical protein [Rhizobium halophilum]|uniref:hypothetical protein n=1 Tax=Rhizobium halophilum TaxID=2846852 RepID=UPI001EFC4066|nr:hypothetical protein [Rhizobium halophilum]MCF6368341.1 hypothetical protein [Rhizobium halophilum]